MGRTRTIARRTFLIGSAAIAGGVAFGVWRNVTPYPNPLLTNLPEGAAALTPYVLINADGITLITPRADLGQGAYAIQALLIAEELDVDPGQVTLDPGPPDRAYWNTGLAHEAAGFTVPGEGRLRDLTEVTLNTVMKTIGLQITGGSTTTPDGYEKLRAAGAAARETLKAAAAQKTGTPVEDLRTRGGAVILPDDTALPYTSLAGIAATLDVPRDVPLRDPSQWRLIGKHVQRPDVPAKSTGTQSYGIDIALPGMVFAAVRLAPGQGSTVESFDATETLAMRGVQAVVPVANGLAVVADNTWRAFQGAEALEVTWTASPLPATQEEHWQVLSDSFTDANRDSRKRTDGDVEAALTADVVEAEFRAPYLAHAPLEPLNATVRVDEDGVEVWTGTQIPRFVQKNVADITGHRTDQVTLHVEMIGGSFGHRLEDRIVRHAAEVARAVPGTPVKLTYSRETDVAAEYPRQIAMARVRGAVADGQVTALDLAIASPAVVPSQMGRQGVPLAGPDSEIVAGAWDQPFAIPHHRVTGYRAPLGTEISSWRSVGASTGGFFYNAGLDALIHAAGADPMAERLRLCSDPLARKVLEAVAGMSGWDGPNPAPKTGRGVALTRSFGVLCAEVVEVVDTEDGLTIPRVWVAAEVGRVIDPVNFEAQVTGGVIWGLGHAINAEVTFADGAIEQTNFPDFPGLALYQTPDITVLGLENGARVTGIGEPPVPPAAPALAGAIFAATGTRLTEMPFAKFVDFA